ncbi:MAG TPA: bifunctional metallophosphatase/5'-nucleotidase [Bacteroidetes bacterium]|nr:bifunctional metallophosphatase/5'-nucleotidase [Bacteroidota bacterium]
MMCELNIFSMFNFRNVFLLGMLFSLVACTGSGSQNSKLAADLGEDIEFIVLQLNDVYDISPLDNGRVGGMARVAEMRAQLLSTNPNVITVLDGDYLNPSLIGSLKCNIDGKDERVNGRQMVETMNALGVDYVTFGNHEFDLREGDLLARLSESKFQVICANAMHNLADGSKVPFQQNGVDIPPYAVHLVKSPQGTVLRVGLLGLVIDSNPKDYVTYLDPFVQGRIALDKVKEESEVVLGLTHLAMGTDMELAKNVPGMPLIFGGHEHVNMTRTVGETSIWKADANAKTVYVHWCTYNTKTKKLDAFSQLIPVTDMLPENEKVAKVVKKWEDFANSCMENQGYNPNDTIGFYIVPLDGRSKSIRFKQTNLGVLVADAMQAAEVGAEVAFFNSGSIRLDDQMAGFIQERNILETLPFGGGIVQGNVKGADLRRLLDVGLSKSLMGSGAYQQVSSAVTVSGSTYFIYDNELDDDQVYAVVTAGYLASGRQRGLEFVKEIADWKAPDMRESSKFGAPKNDVRDIVIWYMKQGDNLAVARRLILLQK